jgi:2-methylisocitrate lyase-like PEP mutase family enzyme
MATQAEKAHRFAQLHRGATPLLIPNPWDAGSAKVLVALGFQALATTSSGFAATVGRLDGSVTVDEAVAHAAAIAAATDVPVSADFENAFADSLSAVATNVTRAVATGIAGLSVEDFSGTELYDEGFAAERVTAAAQAAHDGDARVVLTARAENHIRGNPDLADTINRLQRYQEAGADVLYAPGLTALDDIRAVVSSVDLPVNVLALPGVPDIATLAVAGVKRVSVGGAFSAVALGALVQAGRELLDDGTYGFWDLAGAGRAIVRDALAD